jgi:hypothetical protein
LIEIFSKMVDSICVDGRKMTLPPRFGIETWNKGELIKVDTSKVTTEERNRYQNWKNEKIKLEKDKKSGVLEASFSYCGRCGRGYLIYIQKVNENWIIERKVDTWIS